MGLKKMPMALECAGDKDVTHAILIQVICVVIYYHLS